MWLNLSIDRPKVYQEGGLSQERERGGKKLIGDRKGKKRIVTFGSGMRPMKERGIM